jgi:polysaccharide deacetylase 2 family uncharacterized protein YibQ
MNRRTFVRKCVYTLGGFLAAYHHLSRSTAFAACWTDDERPKIALIIDDIGNSRKRAEQFLKLDIALTFSILPYLPYSCELAREMNRTGYDVMLHQPMEPFDPKCDPGPGALFVGDNRRRIMDVMQANIDSVPFIAGVNNHMGSKFTENRREMGDTLKIVKACGLYFVDSFTSSHSCAYATAKEFEIPSLSRSIFLDNRQDESAILTQLARLKKRARKKGLAVGIGHPFMETARAIGRFVRDGRNTDVDWVGMSELLC